MSSRESLVEATKVLLAAKGYEATSPRDIQDASGVGQGSFYHHFEGKAELASAALVALSDEMCAEFDDIFDRAGLSGIDAYALLPRDALAGCRIGRIAMEASLEDERIRAPISDYFAHLQMRLSEAFSGLGIGGDPDALADLTIAVVQGGFLVSRATGRVDAQESAASALVALIHSAIDKSDA